MSLWIETSQGNTLNQVLAGQARMSLWIETKKQSRKMMRIGVRLV